MKILHTADWHVGKTLRGGISRAGDHRAVLAEMAALARAEEVDAVLVVGDLFESSAPTPEAEEIVYQGLLDLAATGAVVAVVAGNHDNHRRLKAVAPLLDRCHVVVVAEAVPPDGGGVREVRTRSGELLRLALLPFVSKRHIVRAQELMLRRADEHEAQYEERLREVIAALTAGFASGAVNVLAAHALVHGGAGDEGDRGVQSIFDYWLSPAAFPPTAHYVALGDLHRCQQITPPRPLWYSGSPLALGPTEIGDPKGVLLVDAAPDRPAVARQVPLAGGRRLRRLGGTLDELAALAGTTGDDYLFVAVDAEPRAGLADEVRELFPHAVEVTATRAAPAVRRATDRLKGASVSPHQLFEEYLLEKQARDDAVLALFDRLWEEDHAPAQA